MYDANVCEYIFRTVAGVFKLEDLQVLVCHGCPPAIGSRFREDLAPWSLPFWERSHIPSNKKTLLNF